MQHSCTVARTTLTAATCCLVLLLATAARYAARFGVTGKRLLHHQQEHQGRGGRRVEGDREALDGARVVKAYTQEAAQVEAFSNINREFTEKNMRMVKLQLCLELHQSN